MHNLFNIKGKLNIKKFENNIVISEYNYENLITNIGRNYILKMIGGDTIGGINRIGLGSNNTPPKNSDSRLYNKLILVNVNRDYSDEDNVNFLSIVPENSFSNTVAYNEAGLIYKTQTEEILITRLVFDEPVYQNPSNSLSLSYSLELERGVDIE